MNPVSEALLLRTSLLRNQQSLTLTKCLHRSECLT